MFLPRREDHSNDAHRIPFRDNFTADEACDSAGLAAVQRVVWTMMAAAFASLALCAGAHAVLYRSAPKTNFSSNTSVDKRSVKELRADARSARVVPPAGSEIPVAAAPQAHDYLIKR